MKKRNIIIDSFLLDRISNSQLLWESEKLSFLRYVWYLSKSEQKELLTLI